MSNYKEDYRTFSGWECFKAEGKFCHDKIHESMILVTGSSNFGHGICCKPDFNDAPCNNNGGMFACSQPVASIDTSEEFMNILTNGELNH